MFCDFFLPFLFSPKLSYPITCLIAAEWDILLRLWRPSCKILRLLFDHFCGNSVPYFHSWKLEAPAQLPGSPFPLLYRPWTMTTLSHLSWLLKEITKLKCSNLSSHPCPPSTGLTTALSSEAKKSCPHVSIMPRAGHVAMYTHNGYLTLHQVSWLNSKITRKYY